MRKKNRIARPAYIANVSMFPAEKLRRRNSPSGSIGSLARDSYSKEGRRAAAIAGDQRHEHGRARPPQPRLLDQREHRTRRARPRTAARRGRRPGGPPARGARPAGSPTRISATQTAASGMLIRKIQRHEPIASSSPPASGPSTPAIAPHAVQLPIAPPRSDSGERVHDHRQRARHEQRARDALQRARGHQHADRRRRARTRATPRRSRRPRSRTPAARHTGRRASRRPGSASRASADSRSRPTAARPARRRARAGSSAARRSRPCRRAARCPSPGCTRSASGA